MKKKPLTLTQVLTAFINLFLQTGIAMKVAKQKKKLVCLKQDTRKFRFFGGVIGKAGLP